jgi:hypothetical protein
MEDEYALFKDDVSSMMLIWRRMAWENRIVVSVGNAYDLYFKESIRTSARTPIILTQVLCEISQSL